ncbi:MAG: cation:proton antiporter [Polyangiales bacterium]
MTIVLAYGLVLLLTVSLSAVAARTVLSTALPFLVAGAVIGRGGFGWVDVPSDSASVSRLADIALFTVLFTDGQRACFSELRAEWRASGRALGIGMPLAMVGVALPAHFLAHLGWSEAFLLGAVLAPTDPVFASALVGREDISLRLRRLLNIESGLNDGLALPFVMVFLSLSSREPVHPAALASELGLGLLLGVAIPGLVALAFRVPGVDAEHRLRPLGPLSVGLIVYAACHLLHANPYLAAFAAGSTVATAAPAAAERFAPLGEVLSEVTKFAALLVFGAVITPARLSHLTWREWLVAALALAVVRPLSMALPLARSPLSMKEKAAAAWFGPKGFASVVYGLLVLQSHARSREHVFDLVALTTALSIALHSSADVPVAKALQVEDDAG